MLLYVICLYLYEVTVYLDLSIQLDINVGMFFGSFQTAQTVLLLVLSLVV